ncbi:MAG: hypothetical protein M3Y57_16865 [Acidobacteriota bacterium]|nr:hypothetical protein [Acidobacteriota bacterium]
MSNSWTATYTPTSAQSGRLSVTGQCVSIGGETFTLHRHHPHGTKPGILLLDKLGVIAPGVVHNNVARTIPVTYEEEIANQSYSHVEILPDRVSVEVIQASTVGSH